MGGYNRGNFMINPWAVFFIIFMVMVILSLGDTTYDDYE